MKGTLFQKPIELNINIQGETWAQGDSVTGLLEIKSHSGDLNLNEFKVCLAHADLKKVKAKDPKAFKIIETIESGGKESIEFSFKLSEDCPITENSNSLYILYGNDECINNGGYLQLTVEPKKILKEFIEIFQNFHRFQEKGIKNKKGYLDVKFVPPKTREYATIDGVNCLLRTKDNNLEIKYTFKVKNLAYGAHNEVSMAKKNVEIDKVLSPKEYLFYGDSPDQEKITASIGDVLAQVKSKSFL